MKAGLVAKLIGKSLGKVAFKQSMQELMGAIGFIQLIVFLPLIEVKYPGSARLME
jgi:hypothetical protein